MATTTTNYGFDIPQSTDLVKDGATAIATLGQDIDTAMNTALGTKKAGMVLLNTTSFSAVASQSVNDVFSSTYDNYVIVLNGVLGNAGFVSLRLRVGGSDESASQYFTQSIFAGGSSVSAARTSSATSWGEAFRIETAVQNLGMFYLYNPFKTIVTTAQSSLTTAASGSGIDFTSYGRGLNTTTSYTGFTITPATNNITGSISTYGFNK